MYLKKSRIVIGIIAIVVLTSIITIVAINPFGSIVDFLRFSITTKVIDSMYYEDIDDEALVNTAIAGAAVSTGDPYTNYMWGDEARQYMEQIEGNYCGVGLYIESDMEDNLITVVSAIAGGPAEKAEITTGDKIIKIDGEVYMGTQLSEASAYMRGEEGTDVVLTIKKVNGEEKEIRLTRSNIELASVIGRKIGGNIGYISISQFTENISQRFIEEYDKLKEDKIKALIIDLRNNPGGILEEAVMLSEFFVPEGEMITYTLDKREDKIEFKSGDINSKAKKINIPTAILINEGSASASEVFTGALKDYGLATVIGEKSYGKGIVQSVVSLTGEDMLSVTTARYYTPKGVCIHGYGIEPDIEVKMDIEKAARISVLEVNQDEQLLKAVQFLSK